MSAAPPVELFRGTSWEECDDFIVAIRKRAFWEGKQRDSAWIADFAATHFSRKALSWHSQLPEDVRQDWSKLETALIKRWPPPEDDEELQIQPTPAAAPSLNRSEKVDTPLKGVLAFVLDGSNTKYYVGMGNIFCKFITQADGAIYVRCNSLCGTTLLERIGHSDSSCLAAQWTSSTPNIGGGSNDYAFMSLVDPVSLKSSWPTHTPLQILSCRVSDNREVIPVWKDAESETGLFAVAVSTSLYLTTDVAAFLRNTNKNGKTGKFFIEATD